MTNETNPIEELSNLHDTLEYFRRQAAKGHAAFASRVSEIEAQITALEADILSAYPAVETLTAYTLRVLGESLVAPVVEAAPVCGTCGGDGNCFDCDTLTVADASARIDELRGRVQNPKVRESTRSIMNEQLAELEAYIARRQVALNDLNHVLDRDQPAPTDPRPDCTLCGGGGINTAGGASCPACNGSGYETPLPIARDDDATLSDDIVARLEDAAEIYNDYACDCDTDLYQEAADEIRRLRAEVAALLNGEPIISVQYDAEYEPSPWVWNIRRMERTIQNDAKTRELAEQYAKEVAASIRRQNAR